MRRQLFALIGASFYHIIIVCMLTLACSSIVRADDSSVVVVNSAVTVNALSPSELRQIFTGHRQYWNDGKKINVFVLDDAQALHKAFCRETLKMFPYQLSRLWDQLTYSGQGIAPTRVPSQDALINAIENTEGAIGYMANGRKINAKQLEVRE